MIPLENVESYLKRKKKRHHFSPSLSVITFDCCVAVRVVDVELVRPTLIVTENTISITTLYSGKTELKHIYTRSV